MTCKKAVIGLMILAGAVIFVVAFMRYREAEPLRNVVEPITMVNAMSWDDGGSSSLEYRDAKGVTRYACLLNTLDDDKNLVLGSFVPLHEKSQLAHWPVGGGHERAFLQLLERWAATDSDAKHWEERYEKYKRHEIDYDHFLEGSSGGGGDQEVKARAVGMLRDLRRRNR